jgi:hypothetical protein
MTALQPLAAALGILCRGYRSQRPIDSRNNMDRSRIKERHRAVFIRNEEHDLGADENDSLHRPRSDAQGLVRAARFVNPNAGA